MLLYRYNIGSSALLRCLSTKAIIHIPKTSSIHPFGDPSNQRPILRDVEWRVNEGEAWAVMSSSSGDSGKRALFRTLLGHLRVLSDSPVVSEDGIFPFCGHDADPYSLIASVSFSHRSGRSSGGAFYDYTARYGAIRDEDSLTLRESMFPESIPEEKPDPLASSPFEKPKVIKRAFDEVVKLSEEDRQLFEDLVKEMDLEKLLDLPLIALSNGQTRRARIVRTVLRKPELMLLDEPLTGLDIASRPKLLHLLHNLHQTRRPRVILGLRTRDDIPEWITHIALVQDGTVKAGAKGAIVPLIKDKRDFWPTHDASAPSAPGAQTRGEIVLDLKNVNVKYSDRVVLNNINWQIRQGERWHLKGSNGSGKTTLLSLILGDHPQSYVQSHLLLPSPSPSPSSPSTSASSTSTSKFVLAHRKRIPTPTLRQTIGVVSPELFDAFPRRHPGMTVREVIGTGFEGVFIPPPGPNSVGAIGEGEETLRKWREERVQHILDHLGPSAWCSPTLNSIPPSTAQTRKASQIFAQNHFSSLSTGDQRIVLLMRALVGQPPVVILDEVWSGMSSEQISTVKTYLRERVGKEQAVVVVTHWEDEVPWSVGEEEEHEGLFLKRFELSNGQGRVVG